jgi:hypothetical protein
MRPRPPSRRDLNREAVTPLTPLPPCLCHLPPPYFFPQVAATTAAGWRWCSSGGVRRPGGGSGILFLPYDHYRIQDLRRERVPLGEGPFPLSEGFIESKLSVKASRRTAPGEGLFDESCRSSSRWMFAERPIWLSVKKISYKKKLSGHCGPTERPTMPSSAAFTTPHSPPSSPTVRR